ncbi:MAG: DHHA2 domain-containing protein [Nanoarchaeota archaeon]
MATDRILVTSYVDPDIDGISCMVAYSELLRAEGNDVIPVIFGEPQQEVEFVIKRFGIRLPPLGGDNLTYDKIILLDASEPRHMASGLDADKVIEIIDHRKSNDAHLFKNARTQIELVGAAATLVAERLRERCVTPSKEAAILLYSAIVSNTLNFKASVTTLRDRDMAHWVNQTAKLGPEFPTEFFKAKSDLTGERLRIQIDRDFAISEKNGKILGISQIEMVGARELVKTRAAEIMVILDELARRESTGITFLTIADVGEGINVLVTPFPDTLSLLEKALGVRFEDGIAVLNKLLLRKEIAPMVKDLL